MGEPVSLWGWHAGQRQSLQCQLHRLCEVCTGKGGAKEMYPLEASRALKRISAHIKVADGAGVPGVRMVADMARVRMDITSNKEQCQDKETPKKGPVNKKKRSHPVVTGQRVAQQKNSARQWGRPFGRALLEICPAISTHPHWGGDCTTTMRRQDVGAVQRYVAAVVGR